MTEERFLIHELAERAGTTVRTIRYYTDEGLLPQPEMQGKYAYYRQAHLNRLELIRRMKETYLPLREIRQVMLSLTDEEISQRLLEEPPSNEKGRAGTQGLPGSSPEPAAPGARALEYIAQLMEKQAGHLSEGAVSPPQRYAMLKKKEPDWMFDLPADEGFAAQEESWQRITLAAGVELHVREPGEAGTASRIQQLIAYAKKLFY